MNFKAIITVTLLTSFFISSTSIFGQFDQRLGGLSPNGNKFADITKDSENALILKETNERINHVRKWYYYKDYIIGETYEKKYFIVNELSNEIELFENNHTWLESISNNNLNPKYWTRWTGFGGFSNIGDDIILLVFFTFPISIPTIVFFLYRIISKSNKGNLKIYSIEVIIILIVILYFSYIYLGRIYPQSI